MSVAAIRRSFFVVHHLKTQGETRFTDLVHLLSPISRTALSDLLASLEEIGELERDGRKYRLAPNAAALGGIGPTIYEMPPALTAQTHPILTRLAEGSAHSCALFARVGDSTMKIMDAQNRPDPHCAFPPIGQEVPMMPFHGFARLFLAHSPEAVARANYRQWLPYLQPNPNLRVPASDSLFLEDLAKVRKQGYALEYKDEVQPVMRVVVPVNLAGVDEIKFAVGIVSNFVYLLEIQNQLALLKTAATEIARVLQGRVPCSFLSRVTEDPQPAAAWPSRPAREVNLSAFPTTLRSNWESCATYSLPEANIPKAS